MNVDIGGVELRGRLRRNGKMVKSGCGCGCGILWMWMCVCVCDQQQEDCWE